jgi:delta 1-pyrroline-5-carboxylate dehydrogenase
MRASRKRPVQQSLFDPQSKRPEWHAIPAEQRALAIELLVDLMAKAVEVREGAEGRADD